MSIAGRICGGRSLVAVHGTAHDSGRRERVEMQLGLRRWQSFATDGELRHPMLESKKLHRGSEVVARCAREHQQFLTDLAWHVRRGSLSEERGDRQRVARQYGVRDAVQVAEEVRQGIGAPKSWATTTDRLIHDE